MTLTIVQPPGFAPAKGFANGVLGSGQILFIAGQIGWQADQSFATDDFAEQFAQALDNVLAVADAAGAKATDIAEMTVFVTDVSEYRRSTASLGAIWRPRFGKHYPAMALVAVTALVEPRAKVEIQARAMVG